MISRLSLNNDNKEDFDIKIENYYWVFYNESYKIALIKGIKNNNVFEYNLFDINYHQKTFHMFQISDKSFTSKDKTIFKYFDNSQIYPENNDLAIIYHISYPVLLYNFKFKAITDYNLISAGKLFIGINLDYKTISDLNNSNREMLSKITENIQINYLHLNNDQTIIINGGPFSGKSVLAEYIWNTLYSNDLFKKQYKEENDYNELKSLFYINQRLVYLFGNAVIGENKNSSRYLRIFKVHFNKLNNKFPHFTKITTKFHLFEKNRIFNSQLYNNYYIFHIFHAILEAFNLILNSDEETVYATFKDPNINHDLIEFIKSKYNHFGEYIDIFRKKYNNLSDEFNNSKLFDIYIENFKSLVNCTKDLNLNNSFLDGIFEVILSIYMILELTFSVDEEGKAFINRSTDDKDYLFYISKLLDCDIEILKKRLISREIRSPRGSFYVIKFTIEEAIRAKHGLIKYLYENLFDYITNLTNLNINNFLKERVLKIENNEEYKKIVKSSNFVQIVEYFGFENSEKPEENTLENLFINYTNDKLSNLLFEISIRNEAELYFNEGIITEEYMKNIICKNKEPDKSISNTNKAGGRVSISKINTNKSNQDIDIEGTIAACEDNSKGIFKLLDVQSSIARGSFKALCDNIKLSWPNLITTTNSFYLMHFGEVVEYGATDFIQKNIDSINDDLKLICNKHFIKMTEKISEKLSKEINEKLTKKYISTDDEVTTKDNRSSSTTKTLQKKPEANRKFSQNMKLTSNSEKFKQTLNKLIQSIKKTQITFIKLTKTSHNQMDPKHFDEKYVLKQIYSSGILESIIIAKGGFFLRYPYEKLKKELGIFTKFSCSDSDSDFYDLLANFFNISKDDFVKGKNLIFLKNSALIKNKELLNFSNIASVVKRKLLNSLFRKGYFVYKIYQYFLFLMNKKRYENFYDILDKCLETCKKKFFYQLLYQNLQISIEMSYRIRTNFFIYFGRKKFKRLKEIEKFVGSSMTRIIVKTSQTYLMKILKFNLLFEKRMNNIQKLFLTKLKKIKYSKRIFKVIMDCNNRYLFSLLRVCYNNKLVKINICKKMIKTYFMRNLAKKVLYFTEFSYYNWTFHKFKKDYSLKKLFTIYYLSKIRINMIEFTRITKNVDRYEKASNILQTKFTMFFFKEIKIEMVLYYRFKRKVYNFIQSSSKKIKASKRISNIFNNLCINKYYNNFKVYHIIRNKKAKIVSKFLKISANKLGSSRILSRITQNCHENYLLSLFYTNLKHKYISILNAASKKISKLLRKANVQFKFSKKISSIFTKKIKFLFILFLKSKVEQLMSSALKITKSFRIFYRKSKAISKISNVLERGLKNNQEFYFNMLQDICYRIKKASQLIRFLRKCKLILQFSKFLNIKLELIIKDNFINTTLNLKVFHYFKLNSRRKIIGFLRKCKDLFLKVKKLESIFNSIYVRDRKEEFIYQLVNYNLKFIKTAKALEKLENVLFLQRGFDKIYFISKENVIKKALVCFINKLRRNNNFKILHSKLDHVFKSKTRLNLNTLIAKCLYKIKFIIFTKRIIINQIKLFSRKNIAFGKVFKDLITQKYYFNFIIFFHLFKYKFNMFKYLQKQIKDFIAKLKRNRLLLKVQHLIMGLKHKMINFILRQVGMLLQLDHERLMEKQEEIKENEKEISSPVKIKQKSTTSTSIKKDSTKNVVQVRTNSTSKNKLENKKSSSSNVLKVQTNTPVNSKGSIKTPNIKPPKIPNPISGDNKISPKKTPLPPTDPKTKQSEEFRPILKNMSSVNNQMGLKKSSSKSKLTTSTHNLSIDKKLNKEDKKTGDNKNLRSEGRILNKLTQNRSKSNSNLNHSMNAALDNKNNSSILESPKTIKKDNKSVILEQKREDLFSRSLENIKLKGEFENNDESKLNISADSIQIVKRPEIEDKIKLKNLCVLKKSSKEKIKKSKLHDLNKKVNDCDKELDELESEISNFGKVVSLKDEYENNKRRIEMLAKNQKQKNIKRMGSLKQESLPLNFK